MCQEKSYVWFPLKNIYPDIILVITLISLYDHPQSCWDGRLIVLICRNILSVNNFKHRRKNICVLHSIHHHHTEQERDRERGKANANSPNVSTGRNIIAVSWDHLLYKIDYILSYILIPEKLQATLINNNAYILVVFAVNSL